MKYSASIAITLIDPDCQFSLPARWGSDFQIDAIEIIYINGKIAFCLHLSPLQSPQINPFIQGCKSCDCHTDFPYYYLPCLSNPIPPAIGSAWGSLWRVSECQKVLRKAYVGNEGYSLNWYWRLTLSSRREPIQLLTSS